MFHHDSGSSLSPSLLLLHLSRSVCCYFLLFVSFLLICVMFLFSVWDTHFTFGGWVVGYSVDWYPCFLFSCQVAFWIVLPYVRIWDTLCSLIVWYMPLECLHNDLGLTLSDAFVIHMHVGIWFRQFCSVSLPWTISVDTTFWACIPFHCSTTHYKPLAWKTMIIPTLGNFGALELFWEWVLN